MSSTEHHPLRGRAAAMSDAASSGDALREANDRLTLILESIADGFLILDRRWRISYINRKGLELAAADPEEQLVGRVIWERFPYLEGTELGAAYHRAMEQSVPVSLEHRSPLTHRWFHIRAYPSLAGLSVFFQDVSARKEAEGALQTEREILGAIAGDTPLPDVLDQIARQVETRSTDGLRCSILLLDDEGEHLLHGAAPSLPRAYNEAIHGIAIGPGVGSCGTAAFENRDVWVTDIANDPYWKDFKDLATLHGLAACCSSPIRSPRGEVLGTIAMYYPRPHRPSSADERLIRLASDMAAIAIDRRRGEDALRRAEEFNRGIVESSQDCIKTMDLDGTLRWISPAGCKALCIADPAEVVGRNYLDFWTGEDAAMARSALERAVREGSGGFIGHFPVRGEPRWWNVLVTPVRDADGTAEQLLVVSRDVTERVSGERRVRESEAQLRMLANTIPQLAWMATPDGNIFWYNERWYEYTGTTFEQMQGWGWQSVHDPELLPQVVERWKQSLATGAAFEMEFPLRRADGHMRWFLTRVNPMLDAQGQVVRWFGTNTDIDDVRRMRQALEEETRMLELLNRTGMALTAETELQGLLQAVTDAGTRLSGAQFGAFFYNMVDQEGKAYQLFTLSGAPREAFEKFGHPRATPIFAPTFEGQGVIRSDDVTKDPRYGTMPPHHGMPPGHLPVRSYIAVPVKSRSGEVHGGLFFGHSGTGVFSPRTERLLEGIASQAAVALDNARLFEAAQRSGREREELLESERHARNQAEKASRTKDEFLATLSHELRTPLSSILGWANLMRSREPSREELAKGLELIERNARLQARLIEDLLDMSRITSGKLRLDVQPLFPASVLDSALETVGPMADAKGVRIESTIDAGAGPVLGDPSRLQQVVWNLLNNAIKFTPRGGKVQVTLARVNSHVEICVADTGIGIAPDFLDQVFERFRQADGSTTRRHGGLGLGLSIVKHLIELHGGSIRATSEGEGRGAAFTIHLPVAAVQHPTAGEQRVHPKGSPLEPAQDFGAVDLSGLHVLVVDDQQDACDLVARILAECGARVSTVNDGESALAMLVRDRPDILLSDIGMPEMDGYELIKRVRRLAPQNGGRICAVAMTAFARSEDRTRALRSGFQVHLAKPVEPSELVATVASVAGRT